MSEKRYSGVDRFKVAVEGLWDAIRKERHMKIHLAMTTVVLIAGWIFAITKLEWVLLLLTIALVLTAELINTAIERTVDLVTADYHPLAKAAKDIAAGAVMVTAVFAVIIGVIIFWTPVLAWVAHVLK